MPPRPALPFVSKYKNVRGEVGKVSYADLQLSNNTNESWGLSASEKGIAYIQNTSGGGTISVIDVNDAGRNPPALRIAAHRAPVTDIEFAPAESANLLASVGEDNLATVWKVPQKSEWSTLSPLSTPSVSLSGHTKKAQFCRWNPNAAGLLATAGADSVVKCWDVEEGKEVASLDTSSAPVYLAWNVTGSLLAASLKTQKLCLVDPRLKSVVGEADTHAGSKSSKVCWMDGLCGAAHLCLTTGFTKMAAREIMLWDVRKLAKPVLKVDVDKGAGFVLPYWEESTGLLFLVPKGDLTARLFHYVDGALSRLDDFKDRQSQRSWTFAPKRSVDVLKCEIARAYRGDEANTSISVISFCAPRKDLSKFHDDLYGPALTGEPAMAKQEWLDGKTAEPPRAHFVEQGLKGKAYIGSPTAPLDLSLSRGSSNVSLKGFTAKKSLERPSQKNSSSTKLPAVKPGLSKPSAVDTTASKATDTPSKKAGGSPSVKPPTILPKPSTLPVKKPLTIPLVQTSAATKVPLQTSTLATTAHDDEVSSSPGSEPTPSQNSSGLSKPSQTSHNTIGTRSALSPNSSSEATSQDVSGASDATKPSTPVGKPAMPPPKTGSPLSPSESTAKGPTSSSSSLASKPPTSQIMKPTMLSKMNVTPKVSSFLDDFKTPSTAPSTSGNFMAPLASSSVPPPMSQGSLTNGLGEATPFSGDAAKKVLPSRGAPGDAKPTHVSPVPTVAKTTFNFRKDSGLLSSAIQSPVTATPTASRTRSTIFGPAASFSGGLGEKKFGADLRPSGKLSSSQFGTPKSQVSSFKPAASKAVIAVVQGGSTKTIPTDGGLDFTKLERHLQEARNVADNLSSLLKEAEATISQAKNQQAAFLQELQAAGIPMKFLEL